MHAMCERATLPMEAVFNEIAAVAGDDPLGSIKRLTVHALTQVAQQVAKSGDGGNDIVLNDG